MDGEDTCHGYGIAGPHIRRSIAWHWSGVRFTLVSTRQAPSSQPTRSLLQLVEVIDLRSATTPLPKRLYQSHGLQPQFITVMSVILNATETDPTFLRSGLRWRHGIAFDRDDQEPISSIDYCKHPTLLDPKLPDVNTNFRFIHPLIIRILQPLPAHSSHSNP
jgi:hypothetical protein